MRSPVRDGTYNYYEDAIGTLEVGLGEAEVVAILGSPPAKDGLWEEAATGEFIDTWHYPDAGVAVILSSMRSTDELHVRGVSVEAPCTLETALGIRVGSTRAEVLAAYGSFEDPDFRGDAKQFIAGSVYGGLFLEFEGDVVVSMYLGSGGE